MYVMLLCMGMNGLRLDAMWTGSINGDIGSKHGLSVSSPVAPIYTCVYSACMFTYIHMYISIHIHTVAEEYMRVL